MVTAEREAARPSGGDADGLDTQRVPGTPGPVRALAAPLRLFEGFGRYCLLIARAFNFPRDLRPRLYLENLFANMVRVGVDSIPIVAMATAFSGGVVAQQGMYQL